MIIKSYYTLFLLFFFSAALNAQPQFLNGDFENNTADTTCDYNLQNFVFNSKMPGVTAFGDAYVGDIENGGEVDVQSFGCFVDPQNGDWCIGLASTDADPTDSDIVSIELDIPLTVGEEYQLTFWVFGNSNFSPVNFFNLGLSLEPTEFGDLVLTELPDDLAWKEITYDFEATEAYKYVTVESAPGVSCWMQFDNFRIDQVTVSAANLISPDDYSLYPNPASQQITIEAKAIRSVAIYDLSGKIIKSILLEGVNAYSLELGEIPNGSYILKIETDFGLVRERLEVIR